ncbi:MAG TPA: TlpA disulfide reductase family protein, partial [Lacipirellulaceae bacterium]|nr:TlpA disulfide reductase family protein [Lacipirellulaceae bacterium]
VDTWCYFRGGLEVYRDIDANFNRKADNYRWYHTGGARWGLDRNEDGRIDLWKVISAEEAAEEVVTALRTKNAACFQRLLVSKEDIAKLGLPKPLADKLGERLAAAPRTFAALASAGKIDAAAEFTDFGGQRPGAIPAGVRGSTKDLLVYEDVWCMVLSGGQHQQLQLGSMVLVDGAWKLIDGPALGAGDQTVAGFFYDAEGVASPQQGIAALNEPTEEMQKILETIEKLDTQIASAPAEKKSALNAQRADLLEKLAAAAATPAEREQWLKQLADMVSFTVQDGTYPEGVARLEQLETRLKDDKASEELITHVEFRRMQAAWGLALTDPKADYAKVQETWLKQLESFVTAHDSGEHVAEALYQLAIANEYPPGNPEAAQQWYQRLVTEFGNSPNAAKARGAIRRLTSVGKPISLRGPALQGGQVDLAQYKGRYVLLHYWSTAAPSCKADHEMLMDVYSKYGGRKFDVIGVNLDSTQDQAVAYLKELKLPWKQLFEPGGFDSRLANEMGVIQLPQLVLVDDKGAVVTTTLQAAELGEELKKLIASEVAAK